MVIVGSGDATGVRKIGVEAAAGIEPASEKARHEETTCVASLKVFGGGPEIWREWPLPSPIDLGLRLRTEAFGLSRKMTLTHRRAGSAAGAAT